MDDNGDPPEQFPERYVPFLPVIDAVIEEGDRLPHEDQVGVFEAQAVLLQVLPVLLLVLSELHVPRIHTIRMYVKTSATVVDAPLSAGTIRIAIAADSLNR
jgi:hypothetical protein